jgi:hypothetical protein
MLIARYPNYELMNLFVDGTFVGQAHALGGGKGCDPMAPVVSNPLPPQYIDLAPGLHVLRIETETADELYHFGAYYQYDLSFQQQ